MPDLGQVYAGAWRVGAIVVAFQVGLLAAYRLLTNIMPPVPVTVGIALFVLMAWTLFHLAAAGEALYRIRSNIPASMRRWYRSTWLVFLISSCLTLGARFGIPAKWEPFQIIRITAFPTIRDGTVVVVDRRGFPRLPERGSLILFNAPDDARIPNISRAIGLPGDTIQNRSGTLLLNGTAVPRQLYGSAEMAMDDQTVAVRLFTETLPGRRPYNIARANSSSSVNDTPPMTIPPGHIYVLGDNRDFSFDSRYPKRGLIPVTNLLGTTAVITRSPDWADFLSVPN